MFWPAKRTYGPCKARPAGVAVAVGRSGGAEVGGGFVAMGGEVGGKLTTDPHARTSSAVVRIVAAVGLGICPPLVELTPRPISPLSLRGALSPLALLRARRDACPERSVRVAISSMVRLPRRPSARQ